MPAKKTTPKKVNAGEPKIAFVVGDFNELLTKEMWRRAVLRAEELGYALGPTLHVAGTYDTPFAANELLRQKDVAAVVVIAVIITGETKHDELIAHATAKTLQELSLQYRKPVGLGITGPGQTYEQAEARIDRADAAVDAVHRILSQLG
ncbi:MAG TPA: 6,7-dimethyl-8-ribityllumazine synthase [Candidatus Thermoplasmatota archaeon]|nr:6,7-dimethyl-8-ribityllumazine synthase [Candidatus Thermoplasmatota archaeon]